MASNPPDTSAPLTRVFRVHEDMGGLEQIGESQWQQIVSRALPLQPVNAVVRLIVVTGSAEACDSLEALQLQTDNYGYLLEWDLSKATQINTGQINSAQIIDARQLFLQRYLSHRHSWRPSQPLVVEALIRSGYATLL